MPSVIWYASGEDIKDNIKYKYDKSGNICEITENGHIVAKYAYDGLNRLVREDNKPLNKTVLYSYDNCGNITERCEYAYTRKSGEELTELDCTHFAYEYDGDRLVSYNGEKCEYNNNGCPYTYRNKSLEWRFGTRAAYFDGISYEHDGFGKRIKKNNIEFVYDSDGRLIKQSNGLEFIYDDKQVIALEKAQIRYFYRRDVQGNIIALLDENGAVVVRYIYDAWGNHAVVDANGNDIEDMSHIGNVNPFRYRGYYYDAETGLYYLQTRYYDPETGRFISQDSIEYADPEAVNGLNLYAYCGNNPVMNVDPNGNSFLRKVGSWFKNAGNTIKNFFVHEVYEGAIKPATDWIVDVATPAVSNFFTSTVPDFFVNTIYNGGLKPAWNAVSNFFVNTFWNDWIVDKVWNNGLVVAWDWISDIDNLLWLLGAIATVVGAAITIVGAVITLPVWATVLGVVASVVGVGVLIWQSIRFFGG